MEYVKYVCPKCFYEPKEPGVYLYCKVPLIASMRKPRFALVILSPLAKAGVDTMTIKDWGRWESLEMVQRYTRSVSFQDSLKFYKAPLG